GDIGMSELIDDADFRVARNDGIDIHFFEYDAAVFDLAARHYLEISNLVFGVLASIGLDESDHDIKALPAHQVSILEHLVGLADAGRGADIDAEARALGVFQLGEQGLRAWACGIGLA